MATPPTGCNENCGSVGTVSEFYRVSVPSLRPGFFDYHDGVLYEFKEEQSNRCVWERRIAGSFPWNVERLSRYPEGWAFFDVEPVAGKWTWRLSIDIAPLPPFLHGWLGQFDRFAPAVPDPNLNCSVDQILSTYVPLALDPDALIRPVSSIIGSQDIKQITTSCFCFDECPLDTKPHRQYFVQSPASLYPEMVLGKLYRFASVVGPGSCEWTPVTAIPGGGVQKLAKFIVITPPDDHGYLFGFDISIAPTAPESYLVLKPWNNVDDELRLLAARCDRTFTMLEVDLVRLATARPVPEWLCDDVDTRAWDALHPL